MKRIFSPLCIALALLAATARAEPPPPAAEGVTWYAIVTDDGAVLGHGFQEIVQRADGRDVIQNQDLNLREHGADPTRVIGRTLFSEDASGATFAISATSRTGSSWTRTDVRIDAAGAHFVRETPSGRSTKDIALPPAVRVDDGEALLLGWDPRAAPRLEFDNLNIAAMEVEHVIIEAAPGPAPEGRIVALRRRFEGDALLSVARLTLDRDGVILDIAQPMFGGAIHMLTTDRDTALAPHPPYQVVPNSMARSPFRISERAGEGHIRFRLSFEDDITFALPQTGEQSASAEAGVTTVDVCGACGPGLPADAAALADALRSTTWMQSDDPRVSAIAEPVARMRISDARKMELLAVRARAIIERIDYSGHYSALDTIARRAGDCTEAAVLLAALGRAAGIPTRVASGIVYARESYHGVANAFMPHSWTLAWVEGKWRSYDAALPYDSTHIALTIGDGDARSIAAAAQLAGLLRFDAMAEIRPSPGG